MRVAAAMWSAFVTCLCSAGPRADAIPAQAVADSLAAAGCLDVNRASEDALARMPFVGDVMAAAIVEERALRGPFRSLDDLGRISGVTPDLVAAWKPWLRTDEGQAALHADCDLFAVREAGVPWRTPRRRMRATMALRSGTLVTVEQRATATVSATTAHLRTRRLTLTWTSGTHGRRSAPAREAAAGAALLRTLDAGGTTESVALEGESRKVPWTAAWRTPMPPLASPLNAMNGDTITAGDLAAESLAVDDGGGRSRSHRVLTLGCGTPRAAPVAAAARLRFDERGLSGAAVALAGHAARSTADLHWIVWWQDVPRWQVAALSGVPEMGWTWRVDAEGVAARGPLAPGVRLARAAVAARTTVRRQWSARTDIAWDLRAPLAARLRPTVHILAHAELVCAGVATRTPMLDVRLSASAAQDLDAALAREWRTPRAALTATARPWPAHAGAVLAGAVTVAAGGAWCGGWCLERVIAEGAVLRVHALAHATGRGTVVPAWPLLPSTLHPRGAGLDVVLDLRPRDDRDMGSVQVGRAFTPRGTPRWWCQVRLGWPQRG